MEELLYWNWITIRNKQIEKVKKLEEEITQKEAMEEEENNLPKGVLPDNFFDDNVEGAVAMGVKRKQAEKLAKE